MNEVEKRAEVGAVQDHLNEMLRPGSPPPAKPPAMKPEVVRKETLAIAEDPEFAKEIARVPFLQDLVAACRRGLDPGCDPKIQSASITALTKLACEFLKWGRAKAKDDRPRVTAPPHPRLAEAAGE